MLEIAAIHLLGMTFDRTIREELCPMELLYGATVVPGMHKMYMDQATCTVIMQTTAS